MKRTVLLAYFALIIFCLTGCSDEASLQQANISGVPNTLPVRITENIDKELLSFRMYLNTNNRNTLRTDNGDHSMVNFEGVYETEEVPGQPYRIERPGANTYPFNGENISWNLPEFYGGFEIDLPLSDKFVLNGGLSYGKMNGKDYLGESAGIGFRNEGNTLAWRFDMNIAWQQMRYEYLQLVSQNYSDSEKRVYFLNGENLDSYGNLLLSFTLNTKRSEWLVNGFFNYVNGWQTFYNFDAGSKSVPANFDYNEDQLKYSLSRNSIALGLFKDIYKGGRIVAGFRYTKYSDEKGNFSLSNFFLQYDLSVFE